MSKAKKAAPGPRLGWSARVRRLPILRYFEGLRRRLDRALRSIVDLRQIAVADYVDRRLRDEPRYGDPRILARFEHQTFSQGGEDGILREIFHRIGTKNRTFVEFGGGKGWGNNSLLLLHQGWSGAWLEADETLCRRIGRDFREFIDDGRLRLHQAFLTKENIGEQLSTAGVERDVDLLSIDVDGNDYWFWRSLEDWRPAVVIVEYNPSFSPDTRWVMPYSEQHRWQEDYYFGASLKSFEELGRDLGYRLVGCTLAGTNAFFVREDLVDEELFVGPFTAERHFEPARYFLLGRTGHPLRSAAR